MTAHSVRVGEVPEWRLTEAAATAACMARLLRLPDPMASGRSSMTLSGAATNRTPCIRAGRNGSERGRSCRHPRPDDTSEAITLSLYSEWLPQHDQQVAAEVASAVVPAGF